MSSNSNVFDLTLKKKQKTKQTTYMKPADVMYAREQNTFVGKNFDFEVKFDLEGQSQPPPPSPPQKNKKKTKNRDLKQGLLNL